MNWFRNLRISSVEMESDCLSPNSSQKREMNFSDRCQLRGCVTNCLYINGAKGQGKYTFFSMNSN